MSRVDSSGITPCVVVGGTMIAAGRAPNAELAVQGYGAFEPWRSPLLLPSALLVAIGVAGWCPEAIGRRPPTPTRH